MITILITILIVTILIIIFWSRFQKLVNDKEEYIQLVQLAKLYYPDVPDAEALELFKWNIIFRLQEEQDKKRCENYKLLINKINNYLTNIGNINGNK